MSAVSVDESALAAMADQVAVEHEPQVEQPMPGTVEQPMPGASPEQVLQGYQLVTYAVADRAADALAPAWNVTVEEKKSFGDACAHALLLWFPDQIIPPKYMALLVVAGVGLEIVSKRRDPVTGALKPRHHAKPERRPAPAPTAPPVPDPAAA